MQRSDLPVPGTGIAATHFVVARDIEATARFYSEVLGGELVWRGVRPGAPANIWIGINAGGGPTPDKPQIVLDVHDDADRFDTFLNLRVADIQAVNHEWQDRGATFLTPPP
jgi:catechol 2,3-dioxygenase-like lactoylglutathione lyase family enzyme